MTGGDMAGIGIRVNGGRALAIIQVLRLVMTGGDMTGIGIRANGGRALTVSRCSG